MIRTMKSYIFIEIHTRYMYLLYNNISIFDINVRFYIYASQINIFLASLA